MENRVARSDARRVDFSYMQGSIDVFRIGLTALFLVIAANASAQKSTTISDMARFDRALIPALFATEGSGFSDEGSQVAANLANAWEALRKTQKTRAESDSRWAGDAVRIGNWIDTASRLKHESSSREEVHALLLRVRDALRTFRKRNNIRYFPDAVVNFKEQFDEIASSLKDGNFETNYEGIADLVEAWGEVKGFRVDKIAYALDYYRMGEFGAYRETVTASLDVLREAIGRNDLASAIAVLETIQTNTTALYRLFGKFEE